MKKLAFFTLLPLLFAACSSAAPQKNAPTTADSILDNDIYSQATDSNNLERCDDILDGQLKDSCTQVIGDRIITVSALEAMDKSMCSSVSDDRYKTECEKQVDTKIEIQNADQKRMDLQQEAYGKSDITICDAIGDENQKGTCKFNILANQARQKKDPSICEGIGLQGMIEECKSALEK